MPILKVIFLSVMLLFSFPLSFAQVTLNLRNADIRALVDTVASVTGKRFIIDPRVNATVNVVSGAPVAADELYDIFLSVLEVHGFALVEVGKVTKVIPDANAKSSPIPTVEGNFPQRDAIITRVIKIQNVPATQLVPILRPLVPQQGHLAAYPQSNSLILADRAANVERLTEIIRRIDIAGDSEVEVIMLKNASASELVSILTGLLNKQQNQGSGEPQLQVVADTRSNALILSGDATQRLRARGLIATLDTPLEKIGNTEVIFIRYANADDLAPVLQGIISSQQANRAGLVQLQVQGGQAPVKVDIQVNKATNALIITAPPDIQQTLRSVIQQLDIRRAQVLVEAIIAEVSTDKARELGLEFAIDGTPDGKGAVGGTNLANNGGLVSLALNPQALRQGLTLGIGDFNRSGLDFAVLLRALSSDGNTNILSTPSLLTLDNQDAEIVVGQNVPFLTGSFTNTGGTGSPTNPFQTIQRQDIGITLKVKPQINEGNAISLSIEQEVTSLAASAISTVDVITNKRSIKTQVLVEDGQLIVLGGLIDDNSRDSLRKVPGLGDLPFIGNVFRYRDSSRVKQNLMVFIRPRIIRERLVADQLSSEKYNFIRARQLSAASDDKGLFTEQSPILLPELNAFQINLPVKPLMEEK
jgi:general secretion pathway protein D